MIPTLDYYTPTGDESVDLAVKLNLLTQEEKITWVLHESDPRHLRDPYTQLERDGTGQWFTYRPVDTEWTFLVYELSQPSGPTAVAHLRNRVTHPHLQLLGEDLRVAKDFSYRDVIQDLFDTVYHRFKIDAEAEAFISEFTRA